MSARRGIVLVLLLIFLAVSASVAALVLFSFAGGAPPTVPANAVLRLNLDAPFPEIEPNDVFSQFAPEVRTLRSTINMVKRASRDSRIKGLVFSPQVNGALWAQVQELRGAIAEFREAGKPVTAYLEVGGPQEYYLASAASRIVMMPAGQLDISGLVTYEVFFRGALDKIGVVPDLLHIGDYKTASNTFTEKGFTPEHREMSQALNKDWFDQLVAAVAAGRKIDDAEARRRISGGPYLAQQALDAGLVDELAYADQLDDTEPMKGTREFKDTDYLRAGTTSPLARVPGARIALLYGTGTIASGRTSLDGSVLGSETFVEWLRKVRVDPSVRAIVVRIDSPGGSAVASEVMWRELQLTREVKPLVVSMGDVAASGGYYIAAPAHVIVAQPGTITGSIGVVTGKFVLKGALDKIGVGVDSVTDGGNAEIYSPFKTFSPGERAKIEEQMRATYDLFVSRVAQGRGKSESEVDAVARGRVWTGQQAKSLGLVDELGGLDAAIRIAQQRARLDTTKEVDLVVYPPKRSLYEIVANPFGSAAEMREELRLMRSPARFLDAAVSVLSRFRRGEPLAILPNVFWR
ncbi:MAG TPA: signal peptide peptidase SppA [Vicinamibacterales bacterium]|nr:signal peptide peptidase SppA [Vicinamibacterales bacterium]